MILEKITVIVGLSGVGKSTFAEKLASENRGYKIIHTDHYLQYGDYGSDGALNNLTRDVLSEDKPLIVEGSLCYRLLRNGIRYSNFYPKLIIHVGAESRVRQLRRPDKDYSRTDTIYKTIWADYMSILNYSPRIEWIDTTNLI